MFGFGNKFGARTKPQTDEMSPADSPAGLEGAQSALASASEACDAKTIELEEAKNLLAELEQEAGRKDADGEDYTAETAAVQAAIGTVTRLTHAVAILAQRRDDAARSLEAAKQASIEEAKEVARERLLALAMEGEEIFIHLKRFRAELVHQAALAYTAGGIETWGERESLDYFDFFLKRSNRSAAADLADSGAFMKYPTWTYCLRYICGKITP